MNHQKLNCGILSHLDHFFALLGVWAVVSAAISVMAVEAHCASQPLGWIQVPSEGCAEG